LFFDFKLRKEAGAGFEPARFPRKVLPITPTSLPLLNTEFLTELQCLFTAREVSAYTLAVFLHSHSVRVAYLLNVG
jgi:hypothetical protein